MGAGPDAWPSCVIAKTPSGETNTEQAWMSLKQSGKVVTGTAGAHAGQQSEIRDGKTDGEQVEFKVTVGEAAVTVRLKLAGDALKGQAIVETPDGQMTASLDLKRVP